jgi:O-antigen/teichoic acid export membrane protein
VTHDTAHKAIRNVVFSGARLVVAMLATLCTSALIARDLGPANMGVYGYAMWLVGALGVLANVGLPAAITKYISEFLGSGDAGTAVLVGRRLVRAQFIVALAVSAATACFAFLRTPYRVIIVLAAVMILAQALQQSLTAALAGLQRFDRIALTSIYMGLAQLASVGVAALLHSGVVGMLSATLAGLWMGAWLLHRAVNDCLRLPPDYSVRSAENTDVFRRIIRFSFTISYVLLLDTIVWQRSEVLFLKWFSSLP